MDLNEYAKRIEGRPGVTITRDASGNVIQIDSTTPDPEPLQKTGRGGARKGSGRKPITDELQRRNVTVSFRVNAATRDALQDLRAQGIDINRELERLVARLAKRDTKG